MVKSRIARSNNEKLGFVKNGTKLDSVNERGYTFLECPNQECISICSMFGMEPIWYPRIDGNTAIGLTLRAYVGADLRLFFEGLGNIYTSSI